MYIYASCNVYLSWTMRSKSQNGVLDSISIYRAPPDSICSLHDKHISIWCIERWKQFNMMKYKNSNNIQISHAFLHTWLSFLCIQTTCIPVHKITRTFLCICKRKLWVTNRALFIPTKFESTKEGKFSFGFSYSLKQSHAFQLVTRYSIGQICLTNQRIKTLNSFQSI